MIEQYLRAKKAGGRHIGRAGSPRTIEAYRTALQCAERLVDKPLNEWTDIDADELIARFEEEQVAPSYRANILAALRGFYDWAIASGRYEEASPLVGISTPKTERKIPTILSKKDVEVFFSCLSGKYRTFYELMYYGGLRIGEVCQLRKEDIREDGIVVRGKGNKQRYVYLPSALRQKLIALQSSKSDFIFSGDARNAKNDQPITLVQARKVFNTAKEKCGFDIHPHNLRHTSATHFHEIVGDLAVTQEFLGHARPETTIIYAKIANSTLKKASASVFGV